MLRGILGLIFVAGIVLVAAPFAISSYYIDKYGIDVEGKVDRKTELVYTQYSDWIRTSTVTVEYQPPDSPGIASFVTTLDPDAYDSYRLGQRVTVRYLRLRDLPHFPLAQALGKSRLLPVARLGNRTFFSGLDEGAGGRSRRILEWVVGVIVLLVVWRKARWPYFGFAVAGCISVALAAMYISDFPRPTPAPANQVLQASGRVVYVGRIDQLYSNRRSRGIDAEQPMEVAGIEFVPAGRTEPVVAVDLIDAGSAPGLQRDAILPVQYEAASPRTAHLVTATREFPSRNFRGLLLFGGLLIGIIAGFMALIVWFDRAWKRLLGKIKPR